ncbi:MAG: hypothetical protein E7031_09575 [Akkermansiaceae bacterium]|nr:hypothetical protein [Akkermansiaceae bacterium]
MATVQERVLFENEAFRLTATGLQQSNGLVAELEDIQRLHISRNGQHLRTVELPELPAGYTGMRSSIPLLTAMYRMAVRELRANIHQGALLLAGASWSTVWTRDIAYAAALGASLTEPTAVRNSLASRVKDGIVLQDTGTGGGWPISTDRVAWAMGAWCLYESTGDTDWLEYSTQVLIDTIAQDDATLPADSVLRPGETSFIDWREQSYPAHMSMADIGASYAFGTNVLHCMALRIVARMLDEQDRAPEAAHYAERAAILSTAIQENFWSRANMHFSMYRTADGYADDRVDSLATALAIFCGLAGEHARRALDSIPRSTWGTPVFSPYRTDIKDSYHNRAVWPFQEAYVMLAHASLGDAEGAAFSMASLLRAAMAFGSNKENFHAETGEAEDTLLNSDRQLWSVSGMLSMFYYGLFGIRYEHDSLIFSPCVPKQFAGSHWLTNLRIREMELNVHINGYGTEIAQVMINGKAGSHIIPLETQGHLHVEIELMPDEDEAPRNFPMAYEDLPEPLWDSPDATRLCWHPVAGAETYYIYANGKAIGTTPDCQYPLPKSAKSFNAYRVQAVAGSRTSGFSAPFECPAPGTRQYLQPLRIGEHAEYAVKNQQAWLNTELCTSLLNYEPVTLSAGKYAVCVQYCNTTASKRDGDTCALRELLLNGAPVAVVPLPHHTDDANAHEYALTAAVTVEVAEGEHVFSLRYNPATCTNANGTLNQCMVRALQLTLLA